MVMDAPHDGRDTGEWRAVRFSLVEGGKGYGKEGVRERYK